MESYAAGCTALGRRLNAIIAAALALPHGFFDAPGRFDKPQTFLRLLRYSAEVSRPEDGVFAAGAHSDYGMWTLLATDASPGLQIQPRGGAEWVDVAPIPNGLIVNVGDSAWLRCFVNIYPFIPCIYTFIPCAVLERWTNGRFASTRHRVVNTTGAPRYSMPFFFEPNFACVVECLPSCRAADGALPKYPPITSGEYLLGRYGATHAAYGGAPQAVA